MDDLIDWKLSQKEEGSREIMRPNLPQHDFIAPFQDLDFGTPEAKPGR